MEEIIELTIKLQMELEKMSDDEFKEYMKGKKLRFGGKLYVLPEEKPKKKKKELPCHVN